MQIPSLPSLPSSILNFFSSIQTDIPQKPEALTPVQSRQKEAEERKSAGYPDDAITIYESILEGKNAYDAEYSPVIAALVALRQERISFQCSLDLADSLDLAGRGNVASHCELANRYLNGAGVNRNQPKGIHHFLAADKISQEKFQVDLALERRIVQALLGTPSLIGLSFTPVEKARIIGLLEGLASTHVVKKSSSFFLIEGMALPSSKLSADRLQAHFHLGVLLKDEDPLRAYGNLVLAHDGEIAGALGVLADVCCYPEIENSTIDEIHLSRFCQQAADQLAHGKAALKYAEFMIKRAIHLGTPKGIAELGEYGAFLYRDVVKNHYTWAHEYFSIAFNSGEISAQIRRMQVSCHLEPSSERALQIANIFLTGQKDIGAEKDIRRAKKYILLAAGKDHMKDTYFVVCHLAGKLAISTYEDEMCNRGEGRERGDITEIFSAYKIAADANHSIAQLMIKAINIAGKCDDANAAYALSMVFQNGDELHGIRPDLGRAARYRSIADQNGYSGLARAKQPALFSPEYIAVFRASEKSNKENSGL